MKHINLSIIALLISFASFAVPGPITGRITICLNDTSHLTDATSGGTWSSSNIAIATVGSSSGIVTGVATGTATISYTTGTGTVTSLVTINPLPTSYTVFLAGSGSVCPAGPGVHIYVSSSQTPGYSYQLYMTGSPMGAPVAGTGALLDMGANTIPGTYTVAATNTVTGCWNSMTGTATITSLPAPSPIVGPSSVCVGSTVLLTDPTPGGTWSSSTPSAATIGSTGTASGVAAGSTTISYTLTTGCRATSSLSVINLVLPISGPSSICTGAPVTLTDASGGGTWTSSNPAVATIGSSSGTIIGVSAGTTSISYTVGGTCGAASMTVTVHAAPASITGITSICGGAVSTLHDVTTGGVWTSGNTAVATIGTSSGIAVGAGAGTAPISYTVAGCSAVTNLTIDPPPVITGPASVCATATITLNTSINGSWTSSNTAVATIVSGFMSGTVTAVYPGTTVITCNSYSTGCVSTYTVNVTSSCTGTPTAGTAHASLASVCSGNADLLYLSGYTNTCGTSYQWQYSADSLAWSAMPGTNHDSITVHPQSNIYYRCKLTCFSTGLFAYSAGTHVTVFNHITSQSIINTPSTFCNGPDMHLNTCGIAPGTNVLTYYGDGTSDSTHLSTYLPDSSASADIFHTYNYPGTYSVKQLLRSGTSVQDSTTFSFNYNYCRTLPVFFYYDANNNCVFDIGDGWNNGPVTTEVDSNGVAIDTITSWNGFYYKALGDTETIYRFIVIAHDTGLHLSCPTTGIIYDTINSFVNTYSPKYIGFNCSSSVNFNLGIQANMLCARHVANGVINFYNKFCTPEAAVVTMYVSPKYNFVSSYPAPFSVSGQTVTWHLPPLSVYNSGAVPAIYYTLGITGPFLTTGDTVYSSYRITPTVGDFDSSDNFVERVDTIMSSYDPNNISVSPKGYVIPCTPLQYTINFENTGNAAAGNISVIDTLPDNVDPHSIKVVTASAVMNMAIQHFSGHTVVKFDFPHINLPDSSHHNQCNGMVVFSVKSKQGLADGSTIFNRASIYFDDNRPVLTNTVGNIIGISPITGPTNVCNGSSIQLNDLSQFGAWGSSNGTAAVVKGLVTGIGAGLDTINYTLSNACAAKTATKTISINPVVAPGVTITSNTGTGDSVCSYDNPTFTAHPVYGGTTPAYKWYLNSAFADTGATYYLATPVNGDVVSVTMTSSIQCPLPDTAVKSELLIVIDPYVPPITLDAYPGIFITAGMADTFVATVGGIGPMPTFQWLLNGAPISGATTDTFITSTLVNNDSVTCVATGNDICKFSTFNSFIITVGNVGVQNLNKKGQMALFPNPNKGDFTLRGKTGMTGNEGVTIEVMNMMGQLVYRNHIVPVNGFINEHIRPDNVLSKGVYMLSLQAGDERVVFRFVVE